MTIVDSPVDQRCPIEESPSPATISVTDNVGSAWSISNAFSGTGNQAAQQVTPDLAGTTYTISPTAFSGYNFPPTVTNSVNGNSSSFTLFGGETASFTLNYTQPPAFSYSVTRPGDVSVALGSSANNSIDVKLLSGTAQPINFVASGMPSGTSINYSSCSPDCTSTGTITVSSGTAGSWPITVTSGPPPRQITSFTLTITANQPLGATTSGSPNPANTGQNVTWTCTASGGVPPYTFSWFGTDFPTPAPTTTVGSFTFTYTTSGVKTAYANVLDSDGQTSSCTPGSIRAVFNPQFKEF